MAQLQDVTLKIEDDPQPDKKKVTVNFKIKFTPGELGKQFKYDIRLRSEDLSTDEEDAGLPSQVLKNFKFGFFGTNQNETIKAEHIIMPRKATRSISTSILDEDSEVRIVGGPLGTPPITLENPDDIYAEVLLWPVVPSGTVFLTVKARSATWTEVMV